MKSTRGYAKNKKKDPHHSQYDLECKFSIHVVLRDTTQFSSPSQSIRDAAYIWPKVAHDFQLSDCPGDVGPNYDWVDEC